MALNGKYIGAIVVSAVMGGFGGIFLDNYFMEPVELYRKDLNGDRKDDLVIKHKSSKRTVFLQLDGGDYMRLDRYTDKANQTNEGLEQKIQEEAGELGKTTKE